MRLTESVTRLGPYRCVWNIQARPRYRALPPNPSWIVLVVADSAAEETYVPRLESIGYILRIREPKWYEHRMLRRQDPAINLHAFSSGCPEIDRMLVFRDWLRSNAADRDLYADAKLKLAKQEWKFVQNYADAKTSIIEQILVRTPSR